MQLIIDLAKQHTGDLLALLGSGWVLNAISTLFVGRVNKTGKLWAVIRILHGILDRVDPKDEVNKP